MRFGLELRVVTALDKSGHCRCAVTRRQHGRQACPRHVGQVCGLEVIDADPEMTSDERADVEFEVAGSSRPNLRYRCGVGVSLQLKPNRRLSELLEVERGRSGVIELEAGLVAEAERSRSGG